MTFHFAPAVRESVTLLIALAGAFIEGIRAAEAAGAEVVIIDSFSHEYDGQGGIMDWADELEASGTKSPGNWKVPKGAHKKLMNALLQCRASIIFCLRADEKIRIARENGKTVVEPLGWMPICEKRFMFEMTASFTLTPDRPGIPHFDLPHKLQRQHRGMFTDQKPIDEESGRALATWARGGAAAPSTSPDGAADVPTAAEYHTSWNTIMLGATSPDLLAKTWADQIELRKLIAWTEDHPFAPLQARVRKAVESMRAPA